MPLHWPPIWLGNHVEKHYSFANQATIFTTELGIRLEIPDSAMRAMVQEEDRRQAIARRVWESAYEPEPRRSSYADRPYRDIGQQVEEEDQGALELLASHDGPVDDLSAPERCGE
jgi:hypothetical protein